MTLRSPMVMTTVREPRWQGIRARRPTPDRPARRARAEARAGDVAARRATQVGSPRLGGVIGRFGQTAVGLLEVPGVGPNVTLAIAIDVPIWAMAAPRTVPMENRLRSSMGAALRRSSHERHPGDDRAEVALRQSRAPAVQDTTGQRPAGHGADAPAAPGMSSASLVRSSRR